MSVQNSAAPCGTAHFCLSEAQEHRLYRARHILSLLADLAVELIKDNGLSKEYARTLALDLRRAAREGNS